MQIFLNGLVQGLLIALLAIGFHAVFLPTRIFYVALAGIYAAAPYFVVQSVKVGLPFWPGVVLALLGCVGLSMLCEVFNHRLLERGRASPAAHLIASLGLFIMLTEGVALLWGNEARVLRSGFDPTVWFAGVMLTRAQITAATVAAVALISFAAFLRFSRLGLQFRALADNPIQLALMHHNTDRLRVIAFCLAGLFAGVASLLAAYDVGFDPHTGLSAILLAVVAVIVGGTNTYLGPVLGGLLLGITRAGVVWFLSARWQEAATFVLLVLILFLRPEGLIGQKRRLEATS